MLIVQPIGGLCNRIRSINSAFSLAQSRKDSLTILWFCNEELNCPFDKLFQFPPNIRVFNIYSKWNMQKIIYQLTSQFLTNEDIYPYKISVGNKTTPSPEHALFFSGLRKRCYIATEESFYPTQDYHLFVPTLEIQDKLKLFYKNIGSQTYGVHIRRTDNMPSIHTSSTAAFISAMEDKIVQDRNADFYLATDDLLEEKILKERFPGKIISNENRTLSRNTSEGIMDALIDLFCLSKTKAIIGSYHSSFTDIAADIGNISKEIAGIC